MVVATASGHARSTSTCEIQIRMSAYVVHTVARAVASAALVLSFNALAAEPTPDPAEPYAIGSHAIFVDTAQDN